METLYQSAFYTQLSNVEDVDLNLGKASISADPAGEVQALSLTSARAPEVARAAQTPLDVLFAANQSIAGLPTLCHTQRLQYPGSQCDQYRRRPPARL
ncbi:MAG: hypothetical protein IMW91_00020 [Firmicutes bacterium]|nr:hypothetical protein [Bacillota bacterium]